MSCRACGIPIDCAGLDGNPSSDIAPSFGFFATQDYIFSLDCPAGYICLPGRDPVKIIPGTIIPGVTTDGGEMCIQGCLSMICVTPLPGASQSDLQGLANYLFFQWAQQQAVCNNRKNPQGPGLPPPTRIIIPRSNRIDVGNTEQTYTAHCNPESAGDPRSFTVSAGVYTVTLWDASPDQIAATQAQMNASALQDARNSAQALLACGTCNSALHVFQSCAGDPSKITSVDIAAGAYCFPVGTDQNQADAAASKAAVNQLNSQLAGLGCVCPGPTIDVNLSVFNVCVCTYLWNYGSFAQFVSIGPGGFNANTQHINDWGSPLHGFTQLIPQTCPGPTIKLWFP